MFATENGTLINTRLIENIDCDVLKIKPSYDLKEEDIEVYSNDLESGYIKLELISPEIGFGFNYYPKSFTKIH